MPKDLSATLAEIEALPVGDRIRLVGAIWDGIAAESAAFEVPEAHKLELERRLAEADATPDDVHGREDVMSWLRNHP